jgi:site-specific DNA-methyltransferase (adenine-specific)
MGCEGLKEHEQYNESLPCPTRDIRKQKLIKNHHPTVKPIKLMKYLCRLITPPNGIILDPFMGSGSTGIAAKQEGFRFIGIEREQQYLDIAIRRIDNN